MNKCHASGQTDIPSALLTFDIVIIVSVKRERTCFVLVKSRFSRFNWSMLFGGLPLSAWNNL